MLLAVTISPAFEGVRWLAEWFWPFVMAVAAFGLGYICGGCNERG